MSAPTHVHTWATAEQHSPWTCVLLFAWLADSYCESGLVNAGVRKQTIVYHCTHTCRNVFITVRTSEMWAHWGLTTCFLAFLCSFSGDNAARLCLTGCMAVLISWNYRRPAAVRDHLFVLKWCVNESGVYVCILKLRSSLGNSSPLTHLIPQPRTSISPTKHFMLLLPCHSWGFLAAFYNLPKNRCFMGISNI